MQGFGLIINFIIFPLFFLSGALYPLNNLPLVRPRPVLCRSVDLRHRRLARAA